ncbi:MAG: PIG-L family deacetylase [Burkholderiales bacterium]|nr:PIG-L family deacetylase [Burkholderiales bacterium]
MSSVLVVCAHPGDEILGCGGALALHRRRGDEVHVLVLGDGWTSRVTDPARAADAIDLDALEEQGRRALEKLGVERVDYLRYPDNRFDTVPMLDLVKAIELKKAKRDIDVVYTNSAYDLSVDQQKTCRAVVTAFRPLPGECNPEIRCFEVPSSTEWNLAESGRGFMPNGFVDIEAVFDDKIAAFATLATEVRPWPHPRSVGAIEAQARSRGSSIGMKAAEAFQVLRTVITIA